MRWLAPGIALLLAALLTAAFPIDALRSGMRAALLVATAPILGAVLMLAIARLTGAAWTPLAPLARLAPLAAIGALLLGVVQVATPAPAHLALWQQPVAVGARALMFAGGLAFAGARLLNGASRTFAAVTLALYAMIVTPIALDWLLGGTPGHAVSAAGMMLAVEQIGGACAVALASGFGTAGFRRDIGKLLVAAALGLGYLAYMDYLILWYGDLPQRAGWYITRGTTPMSLLACAALLTGVGGVIAAQTLMGEARGLRLAGACGLVGLVLFTLWWVAATLAGTLVALAWLGAAALLARQRLAHD